MRPRRISDDTVVGERRGDHLAQAALDGVVDIGDDGAVGLGLDAEAAAFEGRADDPSCLVGHGQRRRVIARDVGDGNAHGRLAMIRQNCALILAPRDV